MSPAGRLRTDRRKDLPLAQWIIVVMYVRLAAMLSVYVPVGPVAVFHRRVIVPVTMCRCEVFPSTHSLAGIPAIVGYVDMLMVMVQGLMRMCFCSRLASAFSEELQGEKQDASDAHRQDGKSLVVLTRFRLRSGISHGIVSLESLPSDAEAHAPSRRNKTSFSIDTTSVVAATA